MENQNEDLVQEQNVKKGRGRPRKYEEGSKAHEKLVKYSTSYYRSHKEDKIICDNCGESINRFTKTLHQRSKKCIERGVVQMVKETFDKKNENPILDDVKPSFDQFVKNDPLLHKIFKKYI